MSQRLPTDRRGTCQSCRNPVHGSGQQEISLRFEDNCSKGVIAGLEKKACILPAKMMGG